MNLSGLKKKHPNAFAAWQAGPGRDGGKVMFGLFLSDKGWLRGRQELEGGDYVFTWDWDGKRWTR